MNKAIVRSYVLQGLRAPPPEDVRKMARRRFLISARDETGSIVTVWERNDFGKWAFNLRRGGKGTPYYIHTTSEDEIATANGSEFSLDQSHGCIHIRPKDRDTMIDGGYLTAGIAIEVRDYDAKGPPR